MSKEKFTFKRSIPDGDSILFRSRSNPNVPSYALTDAADLLFFVNEISKILSKENELQYLFLTRGLEKLVKSFQEQNGMTAEEAWDKTFIKPLEAESKEE